MSAERIYARRMSLVHGAHAYTQPELAEDMWRQLERVEGSDSIARTVGFVFEHSEIERRYLEIPLPEFDRRPDWYRLANAATQALAERCLRALFSEGTSAGSCGALVVASSSFAGFPSLTRQLQEPFGFPPEALCYDLAGLGCGSPTHALFLAERLLRTGACDEVCVLCVEAMGTFGRSRRHHRPPTTAQLVAHCLASDGAAAIVLSREPGPSDLFSFASCRLSTRLWAGTIDQNDFTADDENQPFISVGKDIRTRLHGELAPLLDATALSQPLFLHPGGAALMRLIRERFPALADTAALSMSVLSKHGNLGAPSVLWVLERALQRQVPITPVFRLVALAPGIVTTCLLFEDVRRGE